MPFCPSCGRPVDANVTFCPNCGYNMQAGAQDVPASGSVPTMPMPAVRQRPSGVAILAALQILGGVLFVIIGILAFAVVGLAASYIDTTAYSGLVGVMAGVIGGILLVIGLIGLGLGYGLWKGSGWAWTATLIFSVLAILAGIASLPSGIVFIAIQAIILYYLTRPHVKTYFGK